MSDNQNQKEMVNVETWALVLLNEDLQTQAFYYNKLSDIFERNFSNQCAYLSEKDAEKTGHELDIEGLQMLKGTMAVEKEFLINTIMDAFVESGLVKGEGGKP